MRRDEYTKLANEYLNRFDRRLGYLEDRGMNIQQLKSDIKEELLFLKRITEDNSNEPVSSEMVEEFLNLTSKLDEHISNFENSVLTMAPKDKKD